MKNTWLKPIFLMVGIVAFAWFLILLGTSWDVTWSDMPSTIIKLLPWLIALAVGLFAITKLTGGRR